MKSEEAAEVKGNLPDLQDKDIERVTKKMQIAFRSKKPAVTSPKPSRLPVTSAQMGSKTSKLPVSPSKTQVVEAIITKPLSSEELTKEDLPDLQDKDVEKVTKTMQIAFKSKKLPKAKNEVQVPDKVVEPVSQSVSINAALGKIEILENEISKLQMELEDSRKQVKLYKDKLDRCRCQTKRIQLPNHKGDASNL